MEELDCNPLYLFLQNRHAKEFEVAQAKGCCFIIPCATSLQDIEIDAQVLHSHILKPSPFFKGQYVPMFSDENKTIQVEGNVIQRITGYDDISDIKILNEEKGYSKAGKTFVVYVTEKPVIQFLKKVRVRGKELDIPSSWLDGSTTPSLQECKMVLQELCKGQALSNLDKRLTAVQENYFFLPEYLEDASRKLYDIVDLSVKEILEENNIGMKASLVLPTIIESYVMSCLHARLFPIICQRFAADDRQLSEKMSQFHKLDVTAAQLGANEFFSCPLPATIVELAQLDSLSFPHKKRQCLKNAVDLVAAEVKQHLQETRGLLTPIGELPCLTMDDLIPVLLSAVINSKLMHLASNLYYMENFLWNVSTKDIHGFSLVTFTAVVELLKTLDISVIKPAKHHVKKELSLEELIEVTDKIEQKNRHIAKDGKDGDSDSEWTPMDREMERITKMIEASTQELNSVQHYGVQYPSK